jgi:hypothetical protein
MARTPRILLIPILLDDRRLSSLFLLSTAIVRKEPPTRDHIFKRTITLTEFWSSRLRVSREGNLDYPWSGGRRQLALEREWIVPGLQTRLVFGRERRANHTVGIATAPNLT